MDDAQRQAQERYPRKGHPSGAYLQPLHVVKGPGKGIPFFGPFFALSAPTVLPLVLLVPITGACPALVAEFWHYKSAHMYLQLANVKPAS
jgi:hypothetical protein